MVSLSLCVLLSGTFSLAFCSDTSCSSQGVTGFPGVMIGYMIDLTVSDSLFMDRNVKLESLVSECETCLIACKSLTYFS